MGKNSHQPTIELNGQRYNALTGRLVATTNALRPSGIVSDIRKSHISHPVRPSKQVHKTVQPSRTLMRKAVQKPKISNIQAVAMDVMTKKMEPEVPKTFRRADSERFKRAEHVKQNSLISRFADFASTGKAHNNPLSNSITPATVPVRELSTPVITSTVTPKSSKTSKLLDKGLRSAESHNAQQTKKAKLHHRIGKKMGLSKRATSIGAGVMAFLIFGTFIAFQNIPNLNVRYAAAKSGVHAGLPGYQPAGFAINNHINYSAGKLTISYKANADSRSYNLTQQNTSWDSQALRDHLASSGEMAPQSYPSNGRTIYLHGNSKADWVAGGVWYSISGSANLNTDQLIKIATSI